SGVKTTEVGSGRISVPAKSPSSAAPKSAAPPSKTSAPPISVPRADAKPVSKPSTSTAPPASAKKVSAPPIPREEPDSSKVEAAPSSIDAIPLSEAGVPRVYAADEEDEAATLLHPRARERQLEAAEAAKAKVAPTQPPKRLTPVIPAPSLGTSG